MNAQSIQDLLTLIQYGEDISLADATEETGIDPEQIRSIQSYKDGGYMTYDDGFVIGLRNGKRLFVTVKEQ